MAGINLRRGAPLLVFLQMAKIRGKLEAIHWRVAARGLPASETAIETVKCDVFSRPLSEGHISVVAKCGSFVFNLQIQSKKQCEVFQQKVWTITNTRHL